MPSQPFCRTLKVRPFVEHTLSPAIPIIAPPQHFIPEKHPERQYFPKLPIAYVNCAFIDGFDAGITPNVRLLTTAAAAVRVTNDLPYANLYNSELDDFVASYRWHAKQLSYAVSVPKSGLYDVSLVFAETDFKFFGAKVHLLTAKVQAAQTYIKMDLNVYEQVGSDTPYLLCFSAVPVESEITITVSSTHDDGYAKLNGFIVTEFDPNHLIQRKSKDVVSMLDCGISRFDWDGLPSNVSLLARENGHNRALRYNVASTNPLLAALASTTRYSLYPLGYDISVEHPGRYDVSLVFSEFKAFGVGKRKFDVHLGALDVFQKKSLDVYSEAGIRTPYILTANDLRVDKKISIRMTDELAGPIISGIVVSKAHKNFIQSATPTQQLSTSDAVIDDSYITTINCGAGLAVCENDPGMTDNVSIEGNVSHYASNATIIGEDVVFMNMGKTFRYSANSFQYTINPREAEGIDTWDVAVILCETVPACLAIGKRIMTVEMVGQDLHRIEDIDIFKDVGAYRTKIIRVRGLKKGSRPDISIRFIKSGGIGAAIVCGIIVAPSAMKHRLMQDTPIPIAYVNCGVHGAYNVNHDGGISENVQFKPVSVYGDHQIRMTGTKILRDMCSAFRHGLYSYSVRVEKPGKYDVFLVFSEIYYNHADERVFDVQVQAKRMYEVESLDVYAEVGKYRPLVVQLTDVEVESTVKIEGKQVKGFPIISGFLVQPSGIAKRIGMPLFFADELVDARQKDSEIGPEHPSKCDSEYSYQNEKLHGSRVMRSTPDIIVDCGLEAGHENLSITGLANSTAGSVANSHTQNITETDPLKKELSSSYRSISSGPLQYEFTSLDAGVYRVTLIFCEYEERELREFTVSIEGIDEVLYPLSLTQADFIKVKSGSSIVRVQSSIKVKIVPGEASDGFLSGITISRIDNREPSTTSENSGTPISGTVAETNVGNPHSNEKPDQSTTTNLVESPLEADENPDESAAETGTKRLTKPSAVLTPQQTLSLKPNDVLYLDQLCTLPVSIAYSVIATKKPTQLVSCFTLNKRRDGSADALSWYLGTDSNHFTFRLYLHAKYAKDIRYREGFLLPLNEAVQVECRIDKTEATYFVNGEKYASGSYSANEVPQRGYFGFNTYGDSEATLKDFTIRMYDNTSGTFDSTISECAFATESKNTGDMGELAKITILDEPKAKDLEEAKKTTETRRPLQPAVPSNVLAPPKSFHLNPNDVAYLEPLCTLPVSITYNVTVKRSNTQFISCFTFNKRRDANADALTWYLATHRHDFTFRLYLHAKFPKSSRHRDGFLLPINKAVQVECRIGKTEATYFVNDEKYATATFSTTEVPQKGYFGFNTYGNSEAEVRDFTIRMYEETSSGSFDSTLSESFTGTHSTIVAERAQPKTTTEPSSESIALAIPSTVLTPRQTFNLKPNDVAYLVPLCTLPVSITYNVTAKRSNTQFISCFTLNKRRDANADALTWYFATHRHDFTFRLYLHAKFPKSSRHRDGFLLPINKAVQVECRIGKTEATYFVNDEKYATATFSSSEVPQKGYFGFNTYGNSEAVVGDFIIRMYKETSSGSFDSSLSESLVQSQSTTLAESVKPKEDAGPKVVEPTWPALLSAVLTPRQTFHLKPNDVAYLEPLCTLPVSITYDVTAKKNNTEFISCFTLNKRRDGRADALTWYLSTHRHDFTFRLFLHAKYAKSSRHRAGFLLPVNKAVQVECRIGQTEATYFVNGEKYATAKYSTSEVPQNGFFGFNTYGNSEAVARNFTVRMY